MSLTHNVRAVHERLLSNVLPNHTIKLGNIMVWQKRSNFYCALVLTAVFKPKQASLTSISFQVALNFWCYFPYKGATKLVHVYVTSLQKHPFLLALRCWGRFARRKICNSAAEIPYWWCKICPESGQKCRLVDGVVTLF